jgi:hypothetical protein
LPENGGAKVSGNVYPLCARGFSAFKIISKAAEENHSAVAEK